MSANKWSRKTRARHEKLKMFGIPKGHRGRDTHIQSLLDKIEHNVSVIEHKNVATILFMNETKIVFTHKNKLFWGTITEIC